MSTFQEGASKTSKPEYYKRFAVLDNRRKRLWTRLQLCYDLIPGLPTNLDKFKVRASQMSQLQHDFYELLDGLVELSTTHSEMEVDTIGMSGAFDELYFEIITRLAKINDEEKAINNTTAATLPPPSVADRTQFPEIQIKKFCGSYEKFPAFISLYNSLIHSSSLTNIEKFSYLLSYLEGSALRLVENVEFNPDNYQIAYDMLVRRFTNRRHIANHYLTSILRLTPAKPKAPSEIQRIVEVLQANVVPLKDLGLPDLADYILLELSLRLLDSDTRAAFELKHLDNAYPSFSKLMSFLTDRCSVSELISGPPTSKVSPPCDMKVTERKKITMSVQEVSRPTHVTCPICKGEHPFSKCPSFLACSAQARHDLVKTHKRCFGCLGTHNIAACKSQGKCRTCGSKAHNTFLHFENIPSKKEAVLEQTQEPSFPVAALNTSVSATKDFVSRQDQISILGTAKVQIRNSFGSFYPCRLVIDSGSQVNFISSQLANKLNLKRSKCSFDLQGIGETSLCQSQGLIDCVITSIYSPSSLIQFEAVVVPRITSDLPLQSISDDVRQRFSHLLLADPNFHKSSQIDMLLGVDAYAQILPSTPWFVRGNPGALYTNLGWVIMGSVAREQIQLPTTANYTITRSTLYSLEHTLRLFWESEEVPAITNESLEDERCEKYFCETTSRDEDGRYIVRLPFKADVNVELGSNREHALSRFYKLEKRFERDPDFHRMYTKNIRDYIEQGHLVPASKTNRYVLTHHGVRKGINSLRVVFSPAERDNRGISLNDLLMTGPKLQADIGQIITQFRIPQVAVTCDIRQMFREVLLHPADRIHQHIFWRFSNNEPVCEYEHTRLIFGAACSPYLAQRTLLKLIEDEGSRYPLAADVLRRQIYVDDILSGADTVPMAQELRRQLVELLQLGKFELGKWASSKNAVVNSDDCQSCKLPTSSNVVKVLGLVWNPSTDTFHYAVSGSSETPSKRGILSRIARIYDVNGYLSPFVFSLKVLLQGLWVLGVDWDDSLPTDVLNVWNRVQNELLSLEQISIPRCVVPLCIKSARLIGFADASSRGMAAVVYLRSETESSIRISLIAAKSKVAPLKPMTIPRLELSAACLLSKLLRSNALSLPGLPLENPICFTDSTTVLAWLRIPPFRLKPFIANRVGQIHDHAPDSVWRHVPGTCNPADPASRGLFPSELVVCGLWWRGPDFLYQPISEWPCGTVDLCDDPPELRKESRLVCTAIMDTTPFESLFERVSSLGKLQRILAYLLRYVRNLRAKTRCDAESFQSGPLLTKEYNDSLLVAVRLTQAQWLAADISLMSKGDLCSKRYSQLSPYIDSRGFVTVGGRLKYSSLPAHSRHPLLIPVKSRLATLLVDHFHLFSAHGGPQLVQSLVQRKYWIPSARNLIRQRIFKCLKCYRMKATPIQQPMADLPSYRVEPSRTFSHTGLDFAGPFMIKASMLRSNSAVKCYVCLFICMVTKAVHLEVATNLTSEGCLAALDRFIARRGLPEKLYSDRGRNFQGAARVIKDMPNFLDTSDDRVTHYLASRNIEWNFNPPYAPNFGGLWEAGVKAFKHHFRRVVGDQVLSLEEFHTVVIRIEGILNSRPLCVVSNSPDDNIDYLTPGHFMIGGPILSRPEPNLIDITRGRLGRWQLTQQIIQNFWKRWANEYLHTQLFRSKWLSRPQTLSVGDMVFWYSPGTAPTHWPKGRIVKLLPGADGIVRVVRIKTATGEITRPVNKVVLLPPS